MAAQQPVCPVRIGTRTSPPALILIYTRGKRSQDLRKRMMPLRSLGELGPEAAARKMIEAHGEYLNTSKIAFEQIAKLVASLIPPTDDQKCPPTVTKAAELDSTADVSVAPPDTSAKISIAPPAEAVPKDEPKLSPPPLDRGLLQELACDLESSCGSAGSAASIVSTTAANRPAFNSSPRAAAEEPPPADATLFDDFDEEDDEEKEPNVQPEPTKVATPASVKTLSQEKPKRPIVQIKPMESPAAAPPPLVPQTSAPAADLKLCDDFDDFDEEEAPSAAPAPAAKPPPPKLAPIGGGGLTPIGGARLAPLGGVGGSRMPPSSLSSGVPPARPTFGAPKKTLDTTADDEPVDIVDGSMDDDDSALRAFVEASPSKKPTTVPFVQTRVPARDLSLGPRSHGPPPPSRHGNAPPPLGSTGSGGGDAGLQFPSRRAPAAAFDDFELAGSDVSEVEELEEEVEEMSFEDNIMFMDGDAPSAAADAPDILFMDGDAPADAPDILFMDAPASASPKEAAVAGSPRWKAPSFRDLLSDGDGSDDEDDGEALLGRGTTDALSGLLAGRTLGAALKATSTGGGGGGALGRQTLAPLNGKAGGASLAPLAAPLGGGRSFR